MFRALRVEAVRCGKKALRKMQGQEKTDARMHAMNACIKAVLQQDFYMLPMWAQDL
jgi:ABC-type oligopeptide transport system substrate-binding subunit